MASTKAKFGFIKGSSIIDVAELPNPVTKSAISPTGTYDKIYLNTSLSKDEVVSIIEKLDFTYYGGNDNTDNYIYIGYYSSDYSSNIVIAKMLLKQNGVVADNPIYYIAKNGTSTLETIYWGNDDTIYDGWLDFENPVSISNVGGLTELQGLPVGQQNELLKNLVYVEETDESKINTKALYRLPDGTMYHYYNGQWNAVGSGGVEEGATAIEPTGTYDKLYINTSLSFEEINSMIDKLNIENGMTYVGYLSLNSNDEPQNGLFIINFSGVYSVSVIVDGSLVGLISIHDGVTITQEWLDFENPLSINLVNGILENPSVQGQLVGDKNDLIKDFISATPFDNTTNFAILAKRIDSLKARIKALEEA